MTELIAIQTTKKRDNVTEEIRNQLLGRKPLANIETKTFYDYSVPAFDVLEVIGKSMDTNNDIDTLNRANWIAQGHGEDKKYEKIYFMGYSGGGASATRTAQLLLDISNIYVDNIVRVGSPKINLTDDFQDRTTDIYLKGDPVHEVFSLMNGDKFLWFGGPAGEIQLEGLTLPEIGNSSYFDYGFNKVHTAYWEKETLDINQQNNLQKTVSEVIKHMK